MKFVLAFLLTALFAIALGTFLPWWSVALAAFAVADPNDLIKEHAAWAMERL